MDFGGRWKEIRGTYNVYSLTPDSDLSPTINRAPTMSYGECSSRSTHMEAAVAFSAVIFFLSLAFNIADAAIDPKLKCTKKCIADSCDNVAIRYGKYCGVGWTGCPNEEPCDDLDACCKLQDACVDQNGDGDVQCFHVLNNCIKELQKSGKNNGFSKKCPYSVAIPTITQDINMAISLNDLRDNIPEKTPTSKN